MEVQKWMGYVQYGNNTQYIQQQLVNVLVAYPHFALVVESMALPPQVPAPANMFILKGTVQTSAAVGDEFKVKIIILP